MNAAPVESQGWRRGRWLAIIALVLAFQVAIIFYLAGHGTALPPGLAPAPPPKILLPANSQPDSLGSSDPTFLVRANPRGFSGPAWMETPALPYDQPKWTDSAPPSNDLRFEQLGGVLGHFLQTNRAAAVELGLKPEPELPVVVPESPLNNLQSALSVEGELAKRPLLRELKLDSWPATETVEILSNSVVQAGVDQDGNVFSAVLTAGCGSKDADASALALTRAARFEPLRRRGAGGADVQTWGQSIFRWHTVVAAPVTNGAAKP